MKAPLKNEQLTNGRTTNGRTRESSGNLNIFSRNRNPLVSRQVSSVGVSQNKWHDNQGEITPDLHVYSSSSGDGCNIRALQKAFCFFGSLLVTVPTYSLYPRGEGGTPPNNRQKKSSSNDCSYCSFAAVCLLVPLEWAVKSRAY